MSSSIGHILAGLVLVSPPLGGVGENGRHAPALISNPCEGSILDLASPSGPPTGVGSEPVSELGVYVTAITDFQVCAVALKVDHTPMQTIEVDIYEADGITRGPLIASGTGQAVLEGHVFHYVPIQVTLQACRDYDISVQLGSVVAWSWWDELLITEPFDVGGVLHVRDSEVDDDVAAGALAHLLIVGQCLGPVEDSRLDPPGQTFGSCADQTSARGIYITPATTLRLCAVDLEYQAPAAPTLLRANVFEATGTARGNLIATGTAEVSGGPLDFRSVPVNALLVEGKDYDVEVQFTPAAWGCTTDYGSPFTVDNAIVVVDGELAGDASNTILPHIRLDYIRGMGGDGLDLVGPFHGPPYMVGTQDFTDHGVFVRSTIDQELTCLGWRADVVPGQTVRARVYEAAGTARGPLIAEGEMVVANTGMRWQDVPIAAHLEAGRDYDFEIHIPDVNAWEWWHDGLPPGKPYGAFGLLQILDGEQGGSASSIELLQIGMCTCPSNGATDAKPSRPLAFTLAAPYPNPVSAWSMIDYFVDETGPVQVAVYDVSGRRVATLLDGPRPLGHGTVELDARRLASGVYFVRMQTRSKSVSRKIAVLR